METNQPPDLLQKQNTSPLQVSKKRAPIRSLTMGALTTQKLN